MTFEEIIGALPAEKQGEAKAFIEAYQKGAMVRPKDRAEAAKILEGEPLFTAELDSRISRAVESHDKRLKAEIVPGMVEEELKKRNPAKTDAEKKLDELNAKLSEMEKSGALKEQKLRALTKLQAEGLPTNLIDRFIGLTDEETDAGIEAYSKTFAEYGKSVADKLRKELIGQGVPGAGKPASDKPTISRAEFSALDPLAQRQALKDKVLKD